MRASTAERPWEGPEGREAFFRTSWSRFERRPCDSPNLASEQCGVAALPYRHVAAEGQAPLPAAAPRASLHALPLNRNDLVFVALRRDARLGLVVPHAHEDRLSAIACPWLRVDGERLVVVATPERRSRASGRG